MKKLTINDLKKSLDFQNEIFEITDEILEGYLNYCKTRDIGIKDKEKVLIKVLRESNNKISISILNNLLDNWTLSNNSKNLYSSIIKVFLKWLNNTFDLNFNFNLIKTFDPLPSGRESLTRNELEQLKQMLDVWGKEQFKIAFLILATTGMRLGELCSINWNEVKGDSCYIKTEKTGKIRTVWISPEVRRLLDETKFAMKYNSIQEYFARFREFLKKNLPSFNKKLSAHVLRHTVATMAYENGLSVEAISRMLGHDDISTTLSTYIHGNKEIEVQNFKLLQLKPVEIYNSQLLINENRLLRKLLLMNGIDLNNINNYLNKSNLT